MENPIKGEISSQIKKLSNKWLDFDVKDTDCAVDFALMELNLLVLNLKVQRNKFWLGTFISLCVGKWHLRNNAIISTINVNLCNAWKYVILALYFCIDPIQFQIDSIISSKKTTINMIIITTFMLYQYFMIDLTSITQPFCIHMTLISSIKFIIDQIVIWKFKRPIITEINKITFAHCLLWDNLLSKDFLSACV